MAEALFECVALGHFAYFYLGQEVALHRDWAFIREHIVENFEKTGDQLRKRELLVDAEQALVVDLARTGFLNEFVRGYIAFVTRGHVQRREEEIGCFESSPGKLGLEKLVVAAVFLLAFLRGLAHCFVGLKC